MRNKNTVKTNLIILYLINIQAKDIPKLIFKYPPNLFRNSPPVNVSIKTDSEFANQSHLITPKN